MTGRKVRNGTLVGLTVAGDELADLFGVARESIPRWVREDGLPKDGYGKYPVVECVKWMLERMRAKAAGESTEISEERRKLIVSQRIGQELDNAKTREELLDAELVGTAMQHIGAIISTQLDGLAPRIVPQLSQLRDSAAMSRLILDECRSIRGAASREIAHFASSLVAGEDPEPAAKKGRGGVGRRQPDVATG